jgi:hypothetical protein
VVALAGLLAGFPPAVFRIPVNPHPALHGAHDRTSVPQDLGIPPLIFGTGLLQACLQVVRVLDKRGWGMTLFLAGQRTFAEVMMARYVP